MLPVSLKILQVYFNKETCTGNVHKDFIYNAQTPEIHKMSINGWMDKHCDIFMLWNIKNNELLLQVTTSMNIKEIKLSEKCFLKRYIIEWLHQYKICEIT
jgi:hypothetical protein